MLNKKLLAKRLANRLVKGKKEKKRRINTRKDATTKAFGKTRYYLSWWFGSWVLFIFHSSKKPG